MQTKTALTTLAAQLDADAAASSDGARVRSLAKSLRDLSAS
jgi:hypothetical protein